MLKYIILIISFLFINNVSYSKELAPTPKVIPIPEMPEVENESQLYISKCHFEWIICGLRYYGGDSGVMLADYLINEAKDSANFYWIPVDRRAYQTWMSIIQQGSQKKNNLLIR